MPSDHAATRVALLLAARGVAAVTICEHMPSFCDGTYSGTEIRVSSGVNGTLPTELFTDSGQLESLELTENSLSGTIPTEIGLLTKLWMLNLQRNMLSGTIPTEIGKLTRVSSVYLERNSLAGTLPTEIGRLKGLRQG